MDPAVAKIYMIVSFDKIYTLWVELLITKVLYQCSTNQESPTHFNVFFS